MPTIKDLRASADKERATAGDLRDNAQRLLNNFKNYPVDEDQQKRLDATKEAQDLEQKAIDHEKTAQDYTQQADELEKAALAIENEKQEVQQQTQDKLKELDKQENRLRG